MDESKKFVYMLCVDVNELLGSIKKVQMAKGKDEGFLLSITSNQSEGLNRCVLTCVSDTIQATAHFNAQLRLLETTEEGALVLSKESLNKSVSVYMDAVFSDVVTTFSEIEKVIFFKIRDNIVEASNNVSTVPINIKEKKQIIKNPKSEKVKLLLNRADMLAAFRYVSLGTASDSPFGNCYGIKLMYENEQPILSAIGMTAYNIVIGNIAISQIDMEDYPSLCEKMSSIMVDAAKIDQILAANESEYAAIIIYYQDGDINKEALQVNIKVSTAIYMLKPLVYKYPAYGVDLLKNAYEDKKKGFTVDPRRLKSALPVLGLGCDLSNDKGIEIHIYKDQVLICDEDGIDRSHDQLRKTLIKEVETQIPDDSEEEILVMKLLLLIKNLRPYEKKVTISMTDKLVVFSGTDDRIKHGMMRCLSKKEMMQKSEDNNSEINE